ncbi:MAG TPA: superoxide dismutase family protein [Clostridia bacterium]|nr:superoxide dismutase family protein [Clostridia bacterium]
MFANNNGMSNTAPVKAVANVMGSPAYPNIQGTVVFKEANGGTYVQADIAGLPQTPTNFFAFHLHSGNCGGTPTTDASGMTDYFPQSGAHYNPTNQPHPEHAGDFPVLLAAPTKGGSVHMNFFTPRFAVSEAIGRAVIIHQNPDDYRTQPAGDSGTKIACGDVVAK